MLARQPLIMGGESAMQFLRHVATSADIVPPLKGIADTVLEIVETVTRFKTCKDEWKEFRAHIQGAVATALQSVELANVEQSEVKVHVAKLQGTLDGIVKRIEIRQKDPLLMQLRHFLKHPIAISEMRQAIDEAVGLFKLGMAIRTEVNTEKIQHETEKIQRETGKILHLAEHQTEQSVLNKLLYAKGASWDPYRGCLPNTRQHIINYVLSWVNSVDESSNTRIFLLTGVAGSGKSAIAHTIAQRLHETRQLATSFFFDHGTADRNDPRYLISTIVADLCQRDDQLGRCIAAALEEDKTLVGAPISRQFQQLILNPSKEFVGIQPLVIVLDVLDEGCDKDLLQILGNDASELPPSLRIVLTSRMTPDVERLHRKPHVQSASLEIHGKDNMDDIALFVPHKLKEIADRHGLEADWPGQQLIASFRDKAGGLFIWVATVCDYLNSCYYPTKELENLILGSGQSESSAESRMDTLYATILQTCNWNDREFANNCRTLLGAIVAAKSPLTLRALNALHQHDIMGSELALQQLSPLLTGLTNKSTSQSVRFLHQSLRDFITFRAPNASVPTNTHMFAIDKRAHDRAFALLCLNLINLKLDISIPGIGYCSGSKSELPGIPSVDKTAVSEELLYACRFWIDHLIEIELHNLSEAGEQLERFIENKLVLWIELIAACSRYKGLSQVRTWAMDKLENYPALKMLVYNEDLARIVHNLAERFKYMDRREEALLAARDEVAIYCSLLEAGYPGSSVGLPQSLSNLSVYLTDLDYCEDALTAASEAVAIQRELATTDSAQLNADLARSLYRVSVGCGNLGRVEDALGAIEEAVQIQRSLASRGGPAAAHSADMARFLHSHSYCLTDLGRHKEALAVTQESVKLYQLLAKDQPADFTADFAQSLHSLAYDLSQLGRIQDASTTMQGAIGLRRQLVKERPAVFISDLADSLHRVSNYHSDLGHDEEALTVIQEAVALHQQLAKQRPATFTPDLAYSLHSLSYCLFRLGRHEEALKTTREVVKLRRKLATQRPAVFAAALANSLHNLSCDLFIHGSYNDALQVAQEAVELYRQLAAKRPAAYNPDLALALKQLADCFHHLRLGAEAVISSKESVEFFRPLAEQYRAVYSSRFSGALRDLAYYLSCVGCDEEALLVEQEINNLPSTNQDV